MNNKYNYLLQPIVQKFIIEAPRKLKNEPMSTDDLPEEEFQQTNPNTVYPDPNITTPPPQDTSMGGMGPMSNDPSQQGEFGALGAAYGGEEELQLSPKDLGDIYTLKVIYTKMISLDKLLSRMSEREYDDIRNTVKQSLEVFHIITVNYDKFKEKSKSIIKLYQKFLDTILQEVEKISKKLDNKSGGK